MSEVGDAVQVVMLCGRGIMLLGNISLKAALQVAKLINTVYLAKWEGSVSFNRLRQIKGDDFVFINVSSEKKEDLAAIEKEMKSHGILYARMPDLCGGDARTQYAIASSDAVKMKAMLLDHTNGPNHHIRVGPISEADYMMTGKKADGTDTKEMQDLKKSAEEALNTPGKTEVRDSGSMRSAPEKEQKAQVKDIPKSGRKRTKTRNPLTEPVKEEPRAKVMDMAGVPANRGNGEKLPQSQPAAHRQEEQLQEIASDVRMRVRDAVALNGLDSVYWINQKPVYENRHFAQFMMPDGVHTVFVRREDILPMKNLATGNRIAVLFKDKTYSMMNMQKVNVMAADGSKAIAMFKLPGGAVIAQGSQQPDRKKVGPVMTEGVSKKGVKPGSKPEKPSEKTKTMCSRR